MIDLITAKQVRKLNVKPFGCVLFKVNARLQINSLGSQNTDNLVQKVYIHWLKDPLKYLVAKLHGCYPGAISLPVSQNFFVRFFSAPARPPIQVAGNFFTSL